MKALREQAPKCVEVVSAEEAEVIVRTLEAAIKHIRKNQIAVIAAPEAGIARRVALVRSPSFSLDLINPVISEQSQKILSSQEACNSHPNETFNCVRYRNITLQNGVGTQKVLPLTDLPAILVQHAVDHLSGISVFDRTVRMALIRARGELRYSDYCPCASKKRFVDCCMSR
jgi:peptide deformylase